MEEIDLNSPRFGSSQDTSTSDYQEQGGELTELFQRQIPQGQSADSSDAKDKSHASKMSASHIPQPEILNALRSLRPILARRLTNLVLGLLGANAADMPPPDLSEKLLPAKARLMSKALEGLIDPALGRIETWLGARLVDFNDLSPMTTVDQLMTKVREAIHLRLRYDHRSEKDEGLTFKAWIVTQSDAPRALVDLDGLLYEALHTQAEKVINHISKIGPEDLLIRLRHAIFEMAWMIANEEDKAAMHNALEALIDEYVPETLDPLADWIERYIESDFDKNQFYEFLFDKDKGDQFAEGFQYFIKFAIIHLTDRMRTAGKNINPRALAKNAIPIIIGTLEKCTTRYRFEQKLTERLLKWISEDVLSDNLETIINIIVPANPTEHLALLLRLVGGKPEYPSTYKISWEEERSLRANLRSWSRRAVDEACYNHIPVLSQLLKVLHFPWKILPNSSVGGLIPLLSFAPMFLFTGPALTVYAGILGYGLAAQLMTGIGLVVAKGTAENFVPALIKSLEAIKLKDILRSQLNPDSLKDAWNPKDLKEGDQKHKADDRQQIWLQHTLAQVRENLDTELCKVKKIASEQSWLARKVNSVFGRFMTHRLIPELRPESEEEKKLGKLVGSWFHYVELLGDPASCGKHVQLFHRDVNLALKGRVEEQLEKANETARNWLRDDLPGAIYKLTSEARATIASGTLHRQIRSKATPILLKIADKKPKKMGCLTIEESEQSDFVALSQMSGRVLGDLIELAHTEGLIKELDSDDSEGEESIPSREEIRTEITNKLYFRPMSRVPILGKISKVKDLGSIDIWEKLHEEKTGEKLAEGLLKEFMKLRSDEEIARHLTEAGNSLQKSSVKERACWLKAECSRVIKKLPLKERGSVRVAREVARLQCLLDQIENSDGGNRLRLSSEVREMIVVLSKLQERICLLPSSDAQLELVNDVATIGSGLQELLPRLPKTEAEKEHEFQEALHRLMWAKVKIAIRNGVESDVKPYGNDEVLCLLNWSKLTLKFVEPQLKRVVNLCKILKKRVARPSASTAVDSSQLERELAELESVFKMYQCLRDEYNEYLEEVEHPDRWGELKKREQKCVKTFCRDFERRLTAIDEVNELLPILIGFQVGEEKWKVAEDCINKKMPSLELKKLDVPEPFREKTTFQKKKERIKGRAAEGVAKKLVKPMIQEVGDEALHNLLGTTDIQEMILSLGLGALAEFPPEQIQFTDLLMAVAGLVGSGDADGSKETFSDPSPKFLGSHVPSIKSGSNSKSAQVGKGKMDVDCGQKAVVSPYGQGIIRGWGTNTCWMNTAIALLSGEHTMELLNQKEQGSAKSRSRNGVRAKLGEIYQLLRDSSKPLPQKHAMEMMRLLEAYAKVEKHPVEGWANPERSQDLRDVLRVLMQAVGIPKHGIEVQPSLKWVSEGANRRRKDKALDKIWLQLMNLEKLQDQRISKADLVQERGIFVAEVKKYCRKRTFQRRLRNETIDWDTLDSQKAYQRAIYEAQRALNLYDDSRDPRASVNQAEGKIYDVSVPEEGMHSLGSLLQIFGQAPERLYMYFDRGEQNNRMKSPITGLTKPVALGRNQWARVEKIVIYRDAHYYAYVRNPDDPDQWLMIDDDLVQPVTSDEVENEAAIDCYMVLMSSGLGYPPLSTSSGEIGKDDLNNNNYGVPDPERKQQQGGN